MRHFAVQGAVHEQMMHDVRFHQLIVEAAGNRLLLDVWNSMHLELRTLITLHHAADDPGTIAEEHAPTVQALQMRDAELTGKHMRHTIEYAHVLFQQATHAQAHGRAPATDGPAFPPHDDPDPAPPPSLSRPGAGVPSRRPPNLPVPRRDPTPDRTRTVRSTDPPAPPSERCCQ